MKIIYIVFTITLLMADNPSFSKTKSSPPTLKETIQKLTDNLDLIDKYANSLSENVSLLNSGANFEDKQGHINEDLTNIKDIFEQLKLQMSVLYPFLEAIKTPVCMQHFKNFELQYKSMISKMATLIKQSNDPIYAAQIDYTGNGITNFISATSNFRQYLNSLIPVIPDDLLPKIKERLNATDANVNRRTDDLHQFVFTETGALKKDISTVNSKADKIILLLSASKTTGTQFIGLTAYNSSVFGLSYLHRIGKVSSDSTVSHLGAEVLFPFDKANASNPGAFILYGLRYDKILIEAGAGYFKNSRTAENISWKCGLLFAPVKTIGIGASYSPLTRAGVQLAYKW